MTATAFNYYSMLLMCTPNPVACKTMVEMIQGSALSPNEGEVIAEWQFPKFSLTIVPTPKHPQSNLTERGYCYRLADASKII